MSESSVLDTYAEVVEFHGTVIPIVADSDGLVWFSAVASAMALGYNNTGKAIRKNVLQEDRKPFLEIDRSDAYQNTSITRPSSIYINEFGLNDLILSSRKPVAKEFRRWITRIVIPSIRRTGQYTIEKKYAVRIKEQDEYIRKLAEENRILTHNQKKSKYPNKGVVYITRPIDYHGEGKKLGSTGNMAKRVDTLNTSVANDMECLFHMEVDNYKLVEMCAKSLLGDCIYRNKKEYYTCDLSRMKYVIRLCSKLVENNFHCEHCNHSVPPTDIGSHLRNAYGVKHDDKLFISFGQMPGMTGGNGSMNLMNMFDQYVDDCDERSKIVQAFLYHNYGLILLPNGQFIYKGQLRGSYEKRYNRLVSIRMYIEKILSRDNDRLMRGYSELLRRR